MSVVVTGIGTVSALGASCEENWQQMLCGKSGIKLHQPFPELEPRPLALISKQPSELALLTQMVVASALKDAGLVTPLPNCGVVIGSSRGYQAAWEQFARQMHKGTQASLARWLDTLPHMNAISAARQIGVSTSPVLAPMAACATGIWAIAQGTHLIETGQCQQVIAGAVEAPITPLTLTGFKQMGALAKTGAYPFDRYREGLVLGEGATVLVLESIEEAQRRSARIYGQVMGFGLTADGYHISAPKPDSTSAQAAVKQCLDRSRLQASDIDYIHAHGTATQLNDHNEAQLIKYLFPPDISVSSTKGATGHTLGASGALGAAFCLMALKDQILPPCVGLKKPECDLNFVMAPRPSAIQQTLCFSFGFGGQNAVLALGSCHLT